MAETKRDPLADIAPYPQTEEEATAEAMAKHYAAFALMHHHLSMGHLSFDKDRDRYMASIGHTVAYYGVTYLLRELEERAGTAQADAVARELWKDWVDGSWLGSSLWEWLNEEYSIDPDRVRKAAAEVYEAIKAKDAKKTSGGAV